MSFATSSLHTPPETNRNPPNVGQQDVEMDDNLKITINKSFTDPCPSAYHIWAVILRQFWTG